MNLFKLLWCKIVGHKAKEPLYSKECDGSIESYEICDRCGYEINHTTFYDCDDYPNDALINVIITENEEEDGKQ